MAVETAKQFLHLLEASNLLSEEQVAAVRRLAAGTCEPPRTLARQLVQQGWLTRWQAQQLLAGRTKFFLGKYKLLEGLGQGGMGAVFKAEHPGLGRVVAVKMMTKSLLQKPDSAQRFLREIRLAAALDHPNIVTAYDADCVGSTYYLVMEYVPGDTLRMWIKQHGRLPIEWSCEVIRQAALGLQHAHEHGLVHRDIKPTNLLIVRPAEPEQAAAWPPQVKLLDLGLARFVSETTQEGDLTRTGQIMGTPDYMAPEQVRSSRHADIRSDVYALGCTLFHMLAGRVPFDSESVVEKLMARIAHEAPRVRTLRPDIGPRLDDALARMLARDPRQRFPTPGDVADALAPFAAGTADDAAPETVVLDPEPASSHVEAHDDASLVQFIPELQNRAAGSSERGLPPLQIDSSIRTLRRRGGRGKSRTRRRHDSLLFLLLGIAGGLALTALALFAWGRLPADDHPAPVKPASEKVETRTATPPSL